ncbi:MAG: type IV pilus modification protein PilV [Tahibacter sp.]
MNAKGSLPMVSRHRGFTLLEVLVALLIFSLGLIGMAGLTVLSVKTNHSAFLRTQASFIAQAMEDRMRANIIGVWNDDYDATYPSGVGALTCDVAPGCTPAQISQRDKAIFDAQLARSLPVGATATIACTRSGGVAAPAAADLLRRPPYQGNCTMDIVWTESNVQNEQAAAAQQFTWAFQP